MARRNRLDLERHHVHLHKGDWDRLQKYFGDSLGAAAAIRQLTHTVLNRIESRVADASKPLDISKMEISL